MSAARAIAAALSLLVAEGVASAAPLRCLGPAIGHALEGIVQAHGFAGVAPTGYRLERVDVKQDRVELGYDDDVGPAATVVLTMPGPDRSAPPPDARGPHFEHRIVEERGHVTGPARDLMLRAAMIADKAIPPEALGRCEGAPDTATTAFGLVVGAAEVTIVLTALALGVGLRRRSSARRA